MKYLDFPQKHSPFFVGEKIQMIRRRGIVATVLEASSRKSSITGVWYKIVHHHEEEFISGHEWQRKAI